MPPSPRDRGRQNPKSVMFTLETYLTPPRPRLLAHRGLALDVPENTLLAFEHAWQAGARSLESDVHLTSDGEVVISHDPTLTRLTGSPPPTSSPTTSHPPPPYLPYPPRFFFLPNT